MSRAREARSKVDKGKEREREREREREISSSSAPEKESREELIENVAAVDGQTKFSSRSGAMEWR